MLRQYIGPDVASFLEALVPSVQMIRIFHFPSDSAALSLWWQYSSCYQRWDTSLTSSQKNPYGLKGSGKRREGTMYITHNARSQWDSKGFCHCDADHNLSCDVGATAQRLRRRLKHFWLQKNLQPKGKIRKRARSIPMRLASRSRRHSIVPWCLRCDSYLCRWACLWFADNLCFCPFTRFGSFRSPRSDGDPWGNSTKQSFLSELFFLLQRNIHTLL